MAILNKKLIDISAGPATNNTITGSSGSINYNNNYNRQSMSTINADILKDWLSTDTRLVKESELIEMVGKLIVERLDQLLDEDTDKVVRILIENKLFQDENTGLKKQITELEKKIEELSIRLYLLENSGNNLNTNPIRWNEGDLYTQSPSTGGWTTTTVSTINTIEDKKKNLIERIADFFEKKEEDKEQEATMPASGLDGWRGIICTKS